MLAALCAAALGLAVCDVRNHVHVSFRNLASYQSPFQHRCGQLMLLCVFWAVLEVGAFVWAAFAGQLPARGAARAR